MAVWGGAAYNLSLEGVAERVQGVVVTHDMAEVLGIRPIMGRDINPEDDVPGAPNVVLLGHELWRNRFGGDPDLVGTTLRLDGEADVWAPLRLDVEANPWSGYLTGVGRLKPGVTVQQAQQDLERIHKNQIESREVNEVTFPTVEPILERLLGEFRLGFTALLGAVGLLLLIACANIAGLMLARSLARGREMGIRLALGAGRRRIVRQLLTESLVLATAGGILGTMLGYWVFRLIAVTMPEDVAVIAGLAPAFQASRADPGMALQDATHRSTATGGRRRVLSSLVVGEIALSLVLLVVAGLSIRDFQALQAVDPGFRPEGVLTFRVDLPGADYEEAEGRLQFLEAYSERLQALPGVEIAAVANVVPLAGH